LYTITSVVDDIDFEISHILRGEDHVTNTAVQVQLFEAITGAPTAIKFGHTTLLMDEKGQPLSKRLGSLSLGEMKSQGIEPMAICSLMARLGTSMPVEPFHDLLALAQTFDLSTFSRTPPHFNPEDLNILTRKVLQIMPFREIESRLSALEANISESVWDLLRGNLSRLEDIKDWQKIIEGPLNTQVEPEDKEYIEQAAQCLPPEPWGEETWAQWTGVLKEITGRKGKQLFMPLRRAITGLDHGPEMKDFLTLIGYARVRERLLG
jgi:glutamyl-tRNA synthetase